MRLTGGRAAGTRKCGFYTIRRIKSAHGGKCVGGLGSRMIFCALLDGAPKKRFDFVLVPFIFIRLWYTLSLLCVLFIPGYFSYNDFIDTFDVLWYRAHQKNRATTWTLFVAECMRLVAIIVAHSYSLTFVCLGREEGSGVRRWNCTKPATHQYHYELWNPHFPLDENASNMRKGFHRQWETE